MDKIIETPVIRRNIDITEVLSAIEQAAIADSHNEGKLWQVAEYTREVLRQFLRVREYCIANDLPLYSPKDVADMMITGEYKRKTAC
jgi:hypothetical protein